MLKHGRAGVPMEVMGLMLGEFVDDYTVRVIDVFAMPQSGTVSPIMIIMCIYIYILGITVTMALFVRYIPIVKMYAFVKIYICVYCFMLYRKIFELQ